MYQPRTYHHWVKDTDLVSFKVTVRETELYVRASRKLEAEVLEAITRHRAPLEEYIRNHPLFLYSLEPCSVDDAAPAIVEDMSKAARN